MGRFVAGQVVSSTFPFSDLTARKRRPAVIATIADFDDVVLCQITSKPYSGSHAIALQAADFQSGQLPTDSYIRPDKLFTADKSAIDKVHGTLKDKKLRELKHSLCDLFK